MLLGNALKLPLCCTESVRDGLVVSALPLDLTLSGSLGLLYDPGERN